MAIDDLEYSDSDSDYDDAFNEDIDALRSACLLAGANPDDISAGTNCVGGGATTVATSDEEDFDDDPEDDIELVRNLRKRFSDCAQLDSSIAMTPLCSVSPEDGVDDDFETLRAIQRRFAAYFDGGLKENAEDPLKKSEQVGVTNKIASEKEASNNLFVERNNNAQEGFPDCVDANNVATQNPGAYNDGSTLELVEGHDSGAKNVPLLPLRASVLPKSALAFVDAIKKNRSCQKVIRSKLMVVQARIEEIKKLKERVKILKDFQASCKKRTSRALAQKKDARVQLISAVKQRPTSKLSEKKTPAMCYGPPENAHISVYKEALARFPSSVTREKWSKKEIENLTKGVKQQFQEMLLQQSVHLLTDTDEMPEDRSFLDNIVASIKDFDITPQNMRLFVPKINWEHLASMYVPERTGGECQARWLNCEDPLINWNHWTKVEDKNLLHIIQQKGMSNWIDIAVSLGTYRTPFQCLARYQRSLNASIIRREWTKEEDVKLQAAVEEFGENNWQQVASLMEGRTGTQCSNRWLKTLHPARKRVGRWTPEEDKRLKVAVKIFGPKSWGKIAKFVPGRMQAQCRERWANKLDPSLRMGKWTAEEDLLLEAAAREHGYCWSKVASCVPHRTDNQCMRRWMMLFPEEFSMLQAAKKTKKAAMISNFVDRETERPAIGPNDFLQLPALKASSQPKNDNPAAKERKIYRSRLKRSGKVASSGHTCLEEVPQSTNGTEGEIDQDIGTCVARAGKGCRERKRKVITDEANQRLAKDPTLRNRKRKVKSKKKNMCADGDCYKVTSTLNSTSAVASSVMKKYDKTKKRNVKQETDKGGKGNDFVNPALHVSGEVSETDAKSECTEDDQVGEAPHLLSASLTCVNPSIPKPKNVSSRVALKRCNTKRAKVRDEALSLVAVEAEEDEMTLASFIRSCDAKKPTTDLVDDIDGSVNGRRRLKRLKTVDETSSCQMPVVWCEDDMTLNGFYKRMESRRTEAAESESDDNMTLSHFCRKLKKRKVQHSANDS